MEKSKFERIGDDGLIRYRNHVKKLLSEAGIGFEDISDFYSFLNSNYRTEHSGLKKSIMSPMGGSFKRTDIEYLYYILYVQQCALFGRKVVVQQCALSGVTNKMVFDYIKDHLTFDQLIYEYGTDANPDWVYVSWESTGKQRKQVLQDLIQV